MKLELRAVTKSYGGPEGAAVLRGVDFEATSGESVAIAGPSGSGKSTLLNIAGCLDRPTSGQVLLGGTDLARLSGRERAVVRARSVGFVFQMHHLLPQCSVLENVLLPIGADPSLRPADRLRREERARELVRRVGLAERESARPGTLSGGECQRVAVVRALVNEPAVILADEPTGSLDEETAAIVAEVLYALSAREGVLLIVATHSADLAARAGRRLRLSGGLLR